METNESPGEVQEPTLDVFQRMFRAVELVQERLNRACETLRTANVPYAVIGGNAVAAWVATIDDGAVRNTRDVDLLLEEADLPRATVALEGQVLCATRQRTALSFLTDRQVSRARACTFC